VSVPDLSEQLLHPERRESVVADACDLIDDEVGRASGASGLALRSAYRVVRKVRPGAVPQVVNELLPQFARQVDRYHQESRETGRPLADVLNDDPGEVADALLSVADARVERSSKGSVRAAYRRVRGVAERHVVAALPAAAALVDKHVQPDDPSQVP
jgi:Family of unknown function (DUF6918)